MATPATRQGLIDYCLRALGHPVIEINIDDDQLEDRVDEAFQFYRDYHYDAVEAVYLKEQITASTLQIVGMNAGVLGTSNAAAACSCIPCGAPARKGPANGSASRGTRLWT
jgi:hypothetical protein